MPCPLCLLGFASPHSKEDWAKLREPDWSDKLDAILTERREQMFALPGVDRDDPSTWRVG